MTERKQDTVTIIDNSTGREMTLPVVTPVHGPRAFDIRGLYREMGLLSYDPGFMSTASCRSSITFIDGNQGILLYRGYPVEVLAEKSTYLEVAYLLLYGELPTAEELESFKDRIVHHSMIHESVKTFFSGFHHDAHPMAILVGVVGSLSAFYHDSADPHNPVERDLTAHRLIGKIITIAGASYKHSIGEPFVYPNNGLSYCGNLLNMLFSVPAEPYQVDPVAERALDMLFILHADHEQNASTSTVRLAGSSDANPYAAVTAGIASLWGPAHGGANEKVLNMLEEIGDESNIQKFIDRAKDRNDPFRLMGFGHRVYKTHDPRAKIIREMCHEVLEKLGHAGDPLFDLALRLEEIALRDEYFLERNLYPNVDFYSGLIYRALGIPTQMFTVMFAIARTVGWLAHWLEMMSEPEHRISRPRQVYVGAERREYVPLEARR